MTVASAGHPCWSRSSRTRSSNSSGRVDRKMAFSAAPNSRTVVSRSFVLPGRTAVTCTGIRTRAASGKNRANCSAQPTSCSVTRTSSLDRFTAPLDLLAYRLCSRRVDTQILLAKQKGPVGRMHVKHQKNRTTGGGEVSELVRLRDFPAVVRGSGVSA
jgi:hypothetical protein